MGGNELDVSLELPYTTRLFVWGATFTGVLRSKSGLSGPDLATTHVV